MIQLLGRLAIIALLLYAGVSFWYGRTEKQLQSMVAAEKTKPAASAKPKKDKALPVEKTDYAIILTRNIFKSVLEPTGKPIGTEDTDLDSLAETSMQLALLGTVSGSREDARAIIREEKSKKEDIYQVGSEVQGALITRIDRGKVVLQVNGREEVLNIKEPESGAPAAGGMEPVPAQTAEGAENPAPQASPDDNPDRHVPEALPRRRINFRSDAPAQQTEPNQDPAVPSAAQSSFPEPSAKNPPAPAPSGNTNAQPAQ